MQNTCITYKQPLIVPHTPCVILAGFGAAAMLAPLLQNLALSQGDNEEACFCLKAWQGLPGSVRMGGRPSREEALQAVAVINRIRRMLSAVSGAWGVRL